MPTAQDVASRIDHTLLKAEASWPQVAKVIDEAVAHSFASVCVNPVFVSAVRHKLEGTPVKTCTVIGFPLGANDVVLKRSEAAVAIKQGAQEIDFVAHLPHLLNTDLDAASTEFGQIVDAARDVSPSVTIKVIVESAALMATEDRALAERRMAIACAAAVHARCDFIKTSTGFHPAGGATLDAVQLMKKHGENLQIKASGGIRNWDDATAMLDAGADRLGCSAGVAIVTGGAGTSAY